MEAILTGVFSVSWLIAVTCMAIVAAAYGGWFLSKGILLLRMQPRALIHSYIRCTVIVVCLFFMLISALVGHWWFFLGLASLAAFLAVVEAERPLTVLEQREQLEDLLTRVRAAEREQEQPTEGLRLWDERAELVGQPGRQQPPQDHQSRPLRSQPAHPPRVSQSAFWLGQDR